MRDNTTTTKNNGVCTSNKNNIELRQSMLTKCPESIQDKNAHGITPLQYYNKEYDNMTTTRSNPFGHQQKNSKHVTLLIS